MSAILIYMLQDIAAIPEALTIFIYLYIEIESLESMLIDLYF